MRSEPKPWRRLPNNPINPSVDPVVRVACARRGPVPPADYRERWADKEGIHI